MKIYTIIDRTPFVYWTIGEACLGLEKYLKADVVSIDYEVMKRGEDLPICEDADFLFFEIGNPQHTGWSAERLKKHFPNAKLVAFCSDTIYYQINGLGPQLNPELIDLHFEIMPQSIPWLIEKGAPRVERWSWSCSDKLIDMAVEYSQSIGELPHYTERKFDFIGVYGPWTIDNPECWRHHAVKYLRSKGYTFTQGGGTGHQDNDLERLFNHYTNSLVTLGTSSHNRPELTRLGCCKGFRDVLGPLFGSVLIYDDHPNILSSFTCPLPTYKYDDFESIIDVYEELYHDSDKVIKILFNQLAWIYSNTIDKQIVRALIKYNFVMKEDLRDDRII